MGLNSSNKSCMRQMEHWTEDDFKSLRNATPYTAGGRALSKEGRKKSGSTWYKPKVRAAAYTAIKHQREQAKKNRKK